MLWRQSADLLRQRLVGTAWGLDCRHYVGRSSCPRLLREGFLVARLYDLQGTVSLQAAKPPPTGPPRWPRNHLLGFSLVAIRKVTQTAP